MTTTIYNYLKLITLMIFVILIWVGSWRFIDKNIEEKDRGEFGDKFGAVNALFSGLAFAGIIYSIFLQQKELLLQQEELKSTRSVFIQQNFESTFFNLLENQNVIANGIKATVEYSTGISKTKIKNLLGRDFFRQSKKELQKIFDVFKYSKYLVVVRDESNDHYLSYLEDQDSDESFYEDNFNIVELIEQEKKALIEEEIKFTCNYYNITPENWQDAQKYNEMELCKFSIGIFYNVYHFTIGHYFRHLYHILKFLKQSEESELKISNKDRNSSYSIKEKYLTYAQFVQAQMATPELYLLFYNCMVFPKLLELVVYYNILENLHKEDLNSIEHQDLLEGVKLKSKQSIINAI